MGTDPEELLTLVDRRDIRLWVEGDRLRYDAPQGALTPELRARLREHKAQIIALVTERSAAGPNPTALREAPPSFAQRHFWSLQQLDPGGCFFNVPYAFHLRGTLDEGLLRRSVQEVFRRHELLRTTLQLVDGVLTQVIHPAVEIDMASADLGNVPAYDRAGEMTRLIDSELARPFDLARDPCLRVRLFRLADHDHVLFLCLHNVIVEDQSIVALLKELSAHYRATPLSPLSLQYADYARRQQRLLAMGMDARLDYWRQWLAKGDPAPVTTAFAKPRSDMPTFRAGAIWHRFPLTMTERLGQLSRRADVTLFVTVLAGYAAVLSHYSGSADISVGGPASNRTSPELEPLIGSTLSLIAYRFDLSGDPDFWTLLARVRATLVAALTNQDVPFVAVAPLLEPELRRTSPLFRTALNFSQYTAHHQLDLPEMNVTFLEEITNREIRPDLFPVMWEDPLRGGALTCCLLYRQDLYDAETVSGLMADYETLLTTMVDNPMLPISSVPLGGPHA